MSTSGVRTPVPPNIRRLVEIVEQTLDECWKRWLPYLKSPQFRYSVLAGALIGLVFYPILGFCAAGVLEGSIAAAIQSSIGNVGAGSLFAAMQSLGAKGYLAWQLPLLGAVITPALVELILWIHARLLKLLELLSSSLGVKIPTSVMESTQQIQDFMRSKVKLE
ncbi:hypothetical protein FRC00_001234 [Tulasnella sp. 408]|nr:hypothetical protein FRC00_001234 [Tulasnella sp. 408]